MSSLFTAEERRFAEAVALINTTNPFLPERVEGERAALGAGFVAAGAEWNKLPPAEASHPNHLRLTERAAAVLEQVRARWPRDGRVAKAEATNYEELAGFWLYQTYALRFDAVIRTELSENGGAGGMRVEFYPAFKADVDRLLTLPGLALLDTQPAPHLFACAFQIRRAFHHIFRSLAGGSAPMARLRAAIWQSVFTHDLKRYRRVLHTSMGDFATLITGPSGTGKELVARAIALSRYLPFDPRRGGFTDDFSTAAFFPLNLSALSPTLIESELFGHRRGAFTGALADREGWMETCPAAGSVFLDEIGDVETGIQVKLLRVLQSRTFQRLGDTETRTFKGKIIAATNRDLAAEIRAGRFREDFYYRLCSDLIQTPSLRDQLDDSPDELPVLVGYVSTRLLGAGEGSAFARETVDWIGKNLGADYAWPGNFRELEQCMRNLLVRGSYRPAALGVGAGEDWNTLLAGGRLTAEEVLRRYTRQVHAQVGTVEETARRLDLDRRTVKARL
ncbi:sigma-54-dependent transcriptional regulator [Rariglobus hedericola]|nr:sigma 54-interacting transcriptional regulator [Rariglobus hedericola]